MDDDGKRKKSLLIRSWGSTGGVGCSTEGGQLGWVDKKGRRPRPGEQSEGKVDEDKVGSRGRCRGRGRKLSRERIERRLRSSLGHRGRTGFSEGLVNWTW